MKTQSSFLGRGFGCTQIHERLSAIVLVAVVTLFAGAGFGAELITNGTFESPAGPNGALPTGWTRDFNSYGTYGAAAHTGSWGLHAGAANASGGEYQDITTVAGNTYNLTIWAENFGAAVGSSHLDVLVGVPGTATFTFPNGSPSHTTTKFASGVSDTSFLVTGAWQQVTFVFTAPGTTTRIGLYNSQKTGDTMHSLNVDDVSVLPITLYPQIATQPSSQAVENGDNATFSVTVTGQTNALNYTWYFTNNVSTNQLTNFFSTSLTGSLTLTGMTSNNVGGYYAVVTNLYGAATSTVATLAVNYWGLVTNGGFEKNTGNNSTPTGWTKDFNSYGALNTGAHNGSFGLHAGAGSDSGGEYQDITTVAGNSYSLSLWVMNYNANVGSSHLDVLIGTLGSDSFTFPNATNSTTTTKFTSGVTDYSFLVGATWQKISLVFTASGTTTRLGLYNSYKTNDTWHSINVDDVFVTLYTSEPLITNNPSSLIVECGSNVTFTAGAGGATPLGYQWYFNSSPLTGETATALSLPSVTVSQAGNYFVIVTNAYGSATSSVAVLNVMCSGLLTNGGFEFNTGSGSAPAGWTKIVNTYGAWPAQPTNQPPHRGNWVMHAGNAAGNGGEYQDVATVPGQGYQLTFWAVGWVTGAALQEGKVQVGTPGSNNNDLSLNNNAEYVNQVFVAPRFDGGSNWTQFTCYFFATSTVTRVSFQNIYLGPNNGATASAVNIDDARLVAADVPPIIQTQPLGRIVECGSNVTFTVSAIGSGSLGYQWYRNNSPLGDETNTTLYLPGVTTSQAGSYFAIVTNAYGSATSSVAVLNVMCSGLLTNGGFEFNAGNGTMPAGWSLIANSFGSYIFNNGSPHGGSFVLHAGASASDGGEYQDVATTPGQLYRLSFWAVGWPGGNPFQLGLVQVGTPGPTNTSLVLNNNHEYVKEYFTVPAYVGLSNWTLLTYFFTATSTVTRVSLQNVLSGGALRNGVNIDDARLEMWTPGALEILVAPRNLVVETGSNALFTVTAAGTDPLGYQWYFNNTPLDGQTGAQLSLTAVNSNQAGNYFVVVTNTAGSLTSSVATLTVTHSGLLRNGSFEDGLGYNFTDPDGWLVVTNSYGAYIFGEGPPRTGRWVLHPGNANASGGRYQDVATMPGFQYQLTFSAAGWWNGNTQQWGRVQIGTPGADAHSFASNNNVEFVNQAFSVGPWTNVGWTTFTYSFIATSAVTRVSFYNETNVANNFINIDDASLVILPGYQITGQVGLEAFV